MNAQETIGYFEDLKKEQGKINTRERMRTCILFFILLEICFLVLYFFFLSETREGLHNNGDVETRLISFMTGIIAFFSCFMYFSTSRCPTFSGYRIKKEEDINLYNTLGFIYGKEKKKMSAEEFQNFIDIKYEKMMWEELLSIKTMNKKNFDQQKNEIQSLYLQRERLVTRADVLNKEFYHRMFG